MPGRHESSGDYRYGFNGMESDDEVKGTKNSYDFGARMYDPRIGRFLTMDAYASKFPYQSPYVGFDNNQIIYTDPTGDYSIEVIKHDDGTMELKIVTVGYVKGKLADNVISDFHAVYPDGYSKQGVYIDNSGVKWTISVQIDVQSYSESEFEADASGSLVDTDCLPSLGTIEEANQYGNFVCAGSAGLVLHGLWHNTGGDDCYSTEGLICARTGLMKNPDISPEDFIRIGYNYIDNVPERYNGMENKGQKTMVDFIQENGPLNIDPNTIASQQNSSFFWYHNASNFPGGSQELIKDQTKKQQEYSTPSQNPSNGGETNGGESSGGNTSRPKFE